MGRSERVRHLGGDGQRATLRQDHLALEAIGQGLALEILHHEVEIAARRVPEVGDVDDVIVADLVDRLRLHHEARDHLGVA